MWFVSLQIFGSRWGPYCNKIPLSWEAFWRWCPDAEYWRWLLEDQLCLGSSTLLFPAWKKEKGGGGMRGEPACTHLRTPASSLHSVLMLSFTGWLSKKLQTHIFNLARLWVWSCWPRSGHRVWWRMSRKGNPKTQWGQEQDLTFCRSCGFNVSFMQMRISWQCWGWSGIQTWSARGRAIILKCFYWSVDFLSPSFSSSLHPASLLKTPILSHTTKVF